MATKKGPTLRELEDELLARVSARESLAAWIRYRDIGLTPALHHELIIRELEAVEKGEVTRLMLALPPGSAKSTYTSVEFPPWFIGRNPKTSVIAASHTLDLAERFGRKARNVVASREFKNVFEFGIAEDSQAAGKWESTTGAEYFAVGVGGSVTGRRADLGIIDDPVKGREDADSERSRETVWQWYLNDFLTRLKPGSRQVLIMCMTGDTGVLMADGTEKPLRDIRRGDEVGSYDNGKLVSAKVLNWINQGPDNVYAIRTTSGRIIKANERHPFLVCRDGGPEWVRLKELRPKDKMMCLEAHGKEFLARLMAAGSLSKSRDSVSPITQKTDGLEESGRRLATTSHSAKDICATGMESNQSSTTISLSSKEGFVQSASGLQQKKTQGQELGHTSALTTVTTQTRSEDFSATIATLESGKSGHQSCLSQQHSTSDFTTDEIVSITPAGCEDVFDIQVERTENFIANGCTASNTRWHEDDLAGRLLQREAAKWRVVTIPMIADADNDPLGRKIGERLWPEWFTDEMVEDAKKDVRSWNALYQQNPVPEEGNFFKKEWFIEYKDGELPSTLHKYGTSDFAVTDGKGDFTEHAIWGVDFGGDIWLLDWWSGQTAPDIWIDRMCDLIATHKPMTWFGEAGPIRRSIEPFLRKRMDARRTFCNIEWLPSIMDKATRARPFQAMASMGKVKIPKDKPWLAHVMSQILQFPAGRHDDAVDAASLIGRGLEFTRSARRYEPLRYTDLAIP